MPQSYETGLMAFISLLKEGVLRIFFALKIRRLRPGVNPRTWVPKASTLPLDHRSRSEAVLIIIEMIGLQGGAQGIKLALK
jgi:hypothetical protein